MIGRIANGIRKYGVSWLVLYNIERIFKVRLPLNSKLRWKISVKTETNFWNKYLSIPSFRAPGDYEQRTDPNIPLDKEITDLLPDRPSVEILDVGAGPLTFLGKKWKNVKVNITPIDPLADEYNKVIDAHKLIPLVRTQKLDAEKLTSRFAENTFDLTYARNSIDHTYSPEECVLQMLKVTKPNCYVLLIHSQNEAVKEDWIGLHQWNLSIENGDFYIASKTDKINFSKKYASLCETFHTYDAEKDWIHVKLLKK